MGVKRNAARSPWLESIPRLAHFPAKTVKTATTANHPRSGAEGFQLGYTSDRIPEVILAELSALDQILAKH
jgi:hypothetical protein